MKILVVDDEKKIADVLSERLSIRGFDASPVYDGQSALDRLEKEGGAGNSRNGAVDGMILDLRLPDIDGIDVLRQTRTLYPHIKVIILSGHANDLDFRTCMELGALGCFQKPANIAEIIEMFTESEPDRV